MEERKQLSCLEDLNLVTVIGCKHSSGREAFRYVSGVHRVLEKICINNHPSVIQHKFMHMCVHIVMFGNTNYQVDMPQTSRQSSTSTDLTQNPFYI